MSGAEVAFVCQACGEMLCELGRVHEAVELGRRVKVTEQQPRVFRTTSQQESPLLLTLSCMHERAVV